MTFASLAAGDAVFVDANTLTYHFEPHPRWGLACTQLRCGSRMGSSRVTPTATSSAKFPIGL